MRKHRCDIVAMSRQCGDKVDNYICQTLIAQLLVVRTAITSFNSGEKSFVLSMEFWHARKHCFKTIIASWQWRSQKSQLGGSSLFPFLSSPFILPYLPLSFSLPLPFLPLEVGPPKMQLGRLGSAESSPSWSWGGALAEIKFCAFLVLQDEIWWQQL